MKPLLHKTGRSGFTYVEMVIALTLMVSMFLAVSMTTQRANEAYDEGTFQAKVEMDLHRTLDFLMDELEASIGSRLQPLPVAPLASQTLAYDHSTGYVGGVIVPGPRRSVTMVLDPLEFDDGLDNDDDGLIDEGELVWIENEGLPGEISTVYLRDIPEFLEGEVENALDDNGNGLIDEPGLSFELTGNVLTIRLTVERRDPMGRLFRKSAVSSVRVRN